MNTTEVLKEKTNKHPIEIQKNTNTQWKEINIIVQKPKDGSKTNEEKKKRGNSGNKKIGSSKKNL